MGTPSIANIDNDNFLEIIFTGYTTSGDIFAINHDGTNVNNFPASIDEKILRGVAMYDINNNGKDDIVVATENEKFVAVVYDNGYQEIIFQSENKLVIFVIVCIVLDKCLATFLAQPNTAIFFFSIKY